MTIAEIALQYHDAGLRVIPLVLGPDNSLRNALPRIRGRRWVREENGVLKTSWKVFTESQTREEVEEIFRGNPYGIAILTGVNGIEAIDIDSKCQLPDTNLIDDYGDVLLNMDCDRKSIFSRVYLENTKSTGLHIVYSCPAPGPNQELASRPATDEELAQHPQQRRRTLIETRGTGGLLYVYPTPGYSLKHGDITGLTECPLTQEERDILISAAYQLHVPQPEADYRAQQPQPSYIDNGPAPGKLYDENTSASDLCSLLEAHGYRQCGRPGARTYYTRPGKSAGTSVSVIPSEAGRPAMVYVFSSNTAFPQQGRAYTPFQVLTFLQYGGDFSACARELHSRRSTLPQVQRLTPQQQQQFHTAFQHKPDPPDAVVLPGVLPQTRPPTPKTLLRIKEMLGKEFDPAATFPNHTQLYHISPYNQFRYEVAGKQDLVTIKGEQKSGKSYFMSCVAASALLEKPVCGMQLFSKKMLWIDTEQSQRDFHKTIARICEMGNYSYTGSDKLVALPSFDLFFEENCYALEYLLLNTPGIETIFIDGIVDFLRNFNDLEASFKLVRWLQDLGKRYGILIFNGIHLNKSDRKIRGHLGAFLTQKGQVTIKIDRDYQFNINRRFLVDFTDVRSGPPITGFGFIRNDAPDILLKNIYPTIVETETEFFMPPPTPEELTHDNGSDEDLPF